MPKSSRENLSPLASKLREHGATDQKPHKEPLWAGPTSDLPNGGISYSLISRWLTCKERFRIQVIDGLVPRPIFNPLLDFGTMWHICEENYARNADWQAHLSSCTAHYIKSYPNQQQQITHWYNLCKAEFPLYVDYWRHHDKKHKGTKIEPLLQESVFNVPYQLPSGRTVYLKGKWDSVYLFQDKVWLQENKTKSSIDLVKIERQLSFDFQTMVYLIALKEDSSLIQYRDKLAGVRYNVIRRSAHKSVESMVTKIQEDSRNGRISEWFARLDTRISDKDIKTFKDECLNPILETICNWWEWVSSFNGRSNPFQYVKGSYLSYHWRHPFGVRNIIDEGGATDLDYYITTGSRVGLIEATTLFPELEG